MCKIRDAGRDAARAKKEATKKKAEKWACGHDKARVYTQKKILTEYNTILFFFKKIKNKIFRRE